MLGTTLPSGSAFENSRGMDAMLGEIHSNFEARKAKQFSPFLRLLFEAQEYASDLRASPWEFALSPADAAQINVKANDLRWMSRRGWIEKANSSSDGTIVISGRQDPSTIVECHDEINAGSRFILTSDYSPGKIFARDRSRIVPFEYGCSC